MKMKVKSYIYSIMIASLFVSLSVSSLVAQDGDWYSHNGWVVDEVMSGPGGQIVVMNDGQGNYSFLSPQEQTNSMFQIVAIGAEQVRLRGTGDKDPFMIPIMHNNLPLDLICLLTLKLEDKETFVTAPVSNVLTKYVPTENYREELSELLEGSNSSVLVYSDVALVGNGGAENFPPLYNGPSQGSSAVHMTGFRMSLGAFIQEMSQRAGVTYLTDGDESMTFSIYSNNLTPEALIHYVAGLTGTSITKVVAVTEESTPVVSDSKYVSQEKADKVLAKVKALAKAGQTTEAAKLMLKLVKRTEPNYKYYNILSKLCWNAGAKERAVKCLNKSLKIAPGNEYATKALAKIKA